MEMKNINESLFTHYNPSELVKYLDKKNIEHSEEFDSERYNANYVNPSDFYGADESWFTVRIFPKNEKEKEIAERIVNLAGWKIIENLPDGGFTAEMIYGREAQSDGYDELFHITPTKNVKKILKIGLTPRDGGKLGFKRPDRVYLSDYPNDHLVQQLKKYSYNDNESYTILRIDLDELYERMGRVPKLYYDDCGDFSMLYTTENIPPYCISVYDTIEESKMKRRNIIINEEQEKLLVAESIRIHKGEEGKKCKSEGRWFDTINCPHCDGKAFFTMSISDGNKGRGKIKVTDEKGNEQSTDVRTLALYYCPTCKKFIAHNSNK